MKLRKKIILILVLFSILPVIVIGGIALKITQDALIHNIGLKSLDFSDVVGQRINEKLFDIFEHLLIWSNEEELHINPVTGINSETAAKYLEKLNTNFKIFNYLSLYNIDGNLIAASKPELFSLNTNLSDKLDFEKALSGITAISEPSFNPVFKNYSLDFFVPLRNLSDSSHIEGVLIASLDWSHIRDIISSLKIRGVNPNVKDHVMLTKKDGLVISGDAADELFKDNLITSGLRSAALAAQNQEGYLIEESEHHLLSFSAYTYLKNYEHMPNPGWLIIIIQDYDAIFSTIKTLQQLIFIIAAILIALLCFIAYLVGKRITAPILNMTQNAIAIGEGDLTQRISVDSSDEIGELSKSFNKMAENLLQSKKELMRSTRYKHGVINSMSDSLVVISDGQIKEVNHATLNLLGYKNSEELIGKGINTIMEIEVNGEGNANLLKLLTKDSKKEHEIYYKTKSGTKIPMLIGWAVLEDNESYKNQNGSIKLDPEYNNEFIFVGKDISSQKKMQNDLLTSKVKAIEANRAKSEFLSNMSHELRTPLNGIMGITSLLGDIETDEKKISYIDLIEHSSNAMLTILDDILDLSQVESGIIRFEEDEFNLEAMLKETIKILELSANKKELTLNWAISPDITSYSMIGDLARLRQVIINLVGNAITFTYAGEIEVRVRPVTYGNVESKNSYNIIQLIFSVSDTGIGIEKDRIDKIFDSFSRPSGTDDSRTYKRSTGRGLAICKQIIELMGGKIWVESEPGFGSTFYFTANFKQAKQIKKENSDEFNTFLETADEAIPDVNKNSQLKRRASILVVEDKRINQIVVLKLLEKRGYDVHLSNNGKEAILALEHGHYDLILMDIRMPEMDGLEATRIIRESNSASYDPKIPIVAMSAYAMSEDREKCLKAGMNEHLAKPIDKEALYHVIDTILEKNSGLSS